MRRRKNSRDGKESACRNDVWFALVTAMFFVGMAFLMPSMSVTAGDHLQEGDQLQENDPIEIHDWYDLDAVRNDAISDYVLMNDLNEHTDGYEEVASENANDGYGFLTILDPFHGIFDGNHYNISDLVINYHDGYDDYHCADTGGIFASMSEGDGEWGTIKNLNLHNIRIEFDSENDDDYPQDTGILAGEAYGEFYDISAIDSEIVVENYIGDERPYCVGGLFGELVSETDTNDELRSYARVENCSFDGVVEGGSFGVGGLAGGAQSDVDEIEEFKTVIKNSYATADVFSMDDQTGGFLGRPTFVGHVIIEDCYSAGNVSSENGYVGSFVCNDGWEYDAPELNVTNSYYNSEICDTSYDEYAEGRTTDEMTYPHEEGDDTFYDYDENAWNLGDHIIVSDIDGNTGYPGLFYQEEPPPLFNLTIDIVGSGSELNYGEGVHEFEEGEIVSLVADSDDGWEFIDWDGYESTSEKDVSFEMPGDNVTMTANFEVESYDLNIDIVGDGTETEYGEGVHSVDYGESVTLIADSDYGWHFVEWDGYEYSSDEEVSFDMPSQDVIMTATFDVTVLEVSDDNVEIVEYDEYTLVFDFGDDFDLYDAFEVDEYSTDSWFWGERTITTISFDDDDSDDGINGTVDVNILDESNDTISFDELGTWRNDCMLVAHMGDSVDIFNGVLNVDFASVESSDDATFTLDIDNVSDIESVEIYTNPSITHYISVWWSSFSPFTLMPAFMLVDSDSCGFKKD